jgi:hypothetical protein
MRFSPRLVWGLACVVTLVLGCSSSSGHKRRTTNAYPCTAPIACDADVRDAGPDASMSLPRPDAAMTDAAAAMVPCPEVQSCVPDPEGGVPKGVCTASGDCEEAVAIASAMHVDGPIDYPDPPPAGGPHNGCWSAWGVHEAPVADENWVHNLEHGGVVLLYNCSAGCADAIESLGAFVEKHDMTLLTEYPDMKTRFAVVAWGYRLQSDTLDLDALQAFYVAHVDQAPESVSSGPPSGCP